tara:strand:+ start:201 stop:587 length:387 start_codon:yes stop_codon:yes gene_type:complete
MITPLPGNKIDVTTLLQMSDKGRYLAEVLKVYAQNNNLTDLQLFELIDTDSDGNITYTELLNFLKTIKDTNDEFIFSSDNTSEIGENLHAQICRKNLKPKNSVLEYNEYINVIKESVAHDIVMDDIRP